MENNINNVESELEGRLKEIESLEEIENARVGFLGKKGKITLLMQSLRDVAADKKREMGMKINALKQKAEELIAAKKEQIENKI